MVRRYEHPWLYLWLYLTCLKFPSLQCLPNMINSCAMSECIWQITPTSTRVAMYLKWRRNYFKSTTCIPSAMTLDMYDWKVSSESHCQGCVLMFFGRNAPGRWPLRQTYWEHGYGIEWGYCHFDAFSCAEGQLRIECQDSSEPVSASTPVKGMKRTDFSIQIAVSIPMLGLRLNI